MKGKTMEKTHVVAVCLAMVLALAGGSGIVIVRLLRLKPRGFLLFVK